MQRLDREIMDEAMRLVLRKARAKRGDACVGRRRIVRVAEQMRKPFANIVEAVTVQIGRDASAHRRHKRAQAHEAMQIKLLDLAGAERVLKQGDFEFERFDVALDAAKLLRAARHRLKRRRQQRTAEFKLRARQFGSLEFISR